MRVIVTGSRDWKDMYAVYDALGELLKPGGELTVVHGDCPTGADRFASLWCKGKPVTEERHPAQWDRFGRSAGVRRNAEMVALGADLVLAFPLPQGSGTQNCMLISRQKDIHVINYGKEA